MSRRETTASPPSQRAPTSPEEEDEKDNEEDKETRECDAPWKQRPNVVTHTHTAALLSCRERRKERKEIRKAHPLGDSLIDWKERVKERERKRKKEISERERSLITAHTKTSTVYVSGQQNVLGGKATWRIQIGAPHKRKNLGGGAGSVREDLAPHTHINQLRIDAQCIPSPRTDVPRLDAFCTPPGNKNKQKERS